VLGEWAHGQGLPEGLALGSEIEFRDPINAKNKVTALDVDILGEEIQQHMAVGRQVRRIGLSHGDRLSFVLTDALQLKKLKPLDGLDTARAENDGASETQLDRLGTDLLLEGETIAAVLGALFGTMAVESVAPLAEPERVSVELHA
jgi:recombination associated protein RdgC